MHPPDCQKTLALLAAPDRPDDTTVSITIGQRPVAARAAVAAVTK
jgi:hypothetical protein